MMAFCLYVTLVSRTRVRVPVEMHVFHISSIMTQVSVSDKPRIISGLNFEPLSAVMGALLPLTIATITIFCILKRKRHQSTALNSVPVTGRSKKEIRQDAEQL